MLFCTLEKCQLLIFDYRQQLGGSISNVKLFFISLGLGDQTFQRLSERNAARSG